VAHHGVMDEHQTVTRRIEATPKVFTEWGWIDVHKNWIRSVSYNHDGSAIVPCSDNTIIISDETNGARIKWIRASVSNVVFNHDGSRIAGGGTKD